MIERDYIMRLIREFMAALLRFLEKNEIRRNEDELISLYNSYVGDSAFYHTASMDDVMDSFMKWSSEQRIYRIEMLAELYYAEAGIKSGPTRYDLLNRAYFLFDFLDRNSKVYSFERIRKMGDIKKRIEKFGDAESSLNANI